MFRGGHVSNNPHVDADNIVIRSRVNDDLGALVDALASTAETDGYPSRWPDDPASWLRANDVLGAWVADRNGEVLGHVVLRRPRAQMPVTLWCTLSGGEPDACALVSRLFVVPRARGAGVGRALLEAACATAADLERQPVLDVVDTNQSAVRLYRRLGWNYLGSYEVTFHDDGPPELLHCFAAPCADGRRQGVPPNPPASRLPIS